MTMSTYQLWGWGRSEGDEPKQAELEQLAPLVRDHLGLPLQGPEQPAPLAELPADRVSTRLPAPLTGIASSAPVDRAAHSIGRSYRDIVRGIRGRLDAVVDCVLRPTDESQIAAVLDWCSDARVAATKIKPGGYLVFNDFAHADPYLGAYGVHRAVVEFAATRGWKFVWWAYEPNGLYDVALRRPDLPTPA